MIQRLRRLQRRLAKRQQAVAAIVRFSLRAEDPHHVDGRCAARWDDAGEDRDSNY
jgi:hypothetical protein